METVEIVVLLIAWAAAILINTLKGKWGFLVFGALGSPWAIIGMCRLARPNSWWYRKRYDDTRRAVVDARYRGHYFPRDLIGPADALDNDPRDARS